MTDPVRSAVMRRIRGRDTKPEELLRKALWARGLRYRKNAKTPGGRPDIVITSPKVAIFVDGCFWHGCPDHYVRPRSREEFWAAKLAQNVERDCRQVAALEEAGWRVFRVWEHEVFEALDVVADEVATSVACVTPPQRPSWRVFRVEPLDSRGTRERRYLTEVRRLAADSAIERQRHTSKSQRPYPSHRDSSPHRS